MNYKVEPFYYKLDPEDNKVYSGIMTSINGKMYFFDEFGEKIERPPSLRWNDFGSGSGYMKLRKVKCVRFCMWDISTSKYDEEMVYFHEDNYYPLIKRSDEGIVIIDSNMKKVPISYFNTFITHFVEV